MNHRTCYDYEKANQLKYYFVWFRLEFLVCMTWMMFVYGGQTSPPHRRLANQRLTEPILRLATITALTAITVRLGIAYKPMFIDSKIVKKCDENY